MIHLDKRIIVNIKIVYVKLLVIVQINFNWLFIEAVGEM